MPRVLIPGQKPLIFPDSMSPEQMDSIIRTDFMASPEPTSMGAALSPASPELPGDASLIGQFADVPGASLGPVDMTPAPLAQDTMAQMNVEQRAGLLKLQREGQFETPEEMLNAALQMVGYQGEPLSADEAALAYANLTTDEPPLPSAMQRVLGALTPGMDAEGYATQAAEGEKAPGVAAGLRGAGEMAAQVTSGITGVPAEIMAPATAGAVNEALFNLPKAAVEGAYGQGAWPSPEGTTENIAYGMGSLAGFILSPAKTANIEVAILKQIPKIKKLYKGTDWLKSITRQVVHLSAAMGHAKTGDVLAQNSLDAAIEEALGARGEGGLMGLVFGGASQAFPGMTVRDIIARIVAVNAGMDTIQGQNPLDERELATKVHDYLLNTYFAVSGKGTVRKGKAPLGRMVEEALSKKPEDLNPQEIKLIEGVLGPIQEGLGAPESKPFAGPDRAPGADRPTGKAELQPYEGKPDQPLRDLTTAHRKAPLEALPGTAEAVERDKAATASLAARRGAEEAHDALLQTYDKKPTAGLGEREGVSEKPPKPEVAVEGKEPWEMTREEYESRLSKAEPADYSDPYTEDWGSGRGGGKRIGAGQVVGAMGDPPRGKKVYQNRLGKLPESERGEAKLLNDHDQGVYLKARGAGFSHDSAMMATYKEGHQGVVETALAAGKPVPPEVLAGYPDLAKPVAVEKAKQAQEPVETPPAASLSQRVGKPLSEVKVQVEMTREATGEKLNVEKTAEVALKEIRKKSSMYEKLLKCLAG